MGFRNVRGIFWIFGEFLTKKDKKSLVLRISRYSIWEIRYDILFNILKSPIYRHSIISRYDMPTPGRMYAYWTLQWDNSSTVISAVASINSGLEKCCFKSFEYFINLYLLKKSPILEMMQWASIGQRWIGPTRWPCAACLRLTSWTTYS